MFLCLVISSNVKANPIVVPPVTSELYFDNNNNWYLEIVFNAYTGINSSNNLYLATSTDTVQLKPGWIIQTNIPFVITKDSLLNPLTINQSGDVIRLFENNYYQDLDFGCYTFIFGNYPGSTVSAPLHGQSIKRISSSCDYRLVKDNNPTLGYDPFNASATSSVYGYVYDSNHNPFPNLSVFGNGGCFLATATDANGHFEIQGVYACSYHMYTYNTFCINPDTSFITEPDSSYYLEFTFDSCYVRLNNFSKANNYSLQVFPNPGSENFTFQIIAPELNHTNCLIKIYDIAGELVNIILVNNIHDSFASVIWNGKGKYNDLSSGLYTCSFEINGNTVASQKLIIKK